MRLVHLRENSAPPEAKRDHLISYLADIIMVTQAADKDKVADNPEFKRRLAFLRNKLLMGFDLQEGSTGGGSDGNFTAALGVPTLDGLGPEGEGAHAAHEHVDTESFPRRAALVAGLLAS